MKNLYFDFNASTPIAQEVKESLTRNLDVLIGNPSSQHWAGSPFKAQLENSRQQVADLINCSPEEIYFTSGGSESNNHAIKGIFFANMQKGKHIVTSAIEHPAIKNPCDYLKKFGADITYLPVDSYGLINPRDVQNALRKDTILVSIMHSNNEVGTLQSIEEIAEITKVAKINLHTDAAQSVGKVKIDVKKLGVDLLSIAGHKLYAPKGIGALFIRKNVIIDPLIHGAGHEMGQRAGTENILLSIAMGEAAKLAINTVSNNMTEVSQLRDKMWKLLKVEFGDKIVRNGHIHRCLPNTLNISFVDRSGNQILSKLPNLAASTGSACHSGHDTISPVLKAMNIDFRIALGAIRFSLGTTTTLDEVHEVIYSLKKLNLYS
ncbi:MAG: cysteine desulfurase family protein [Pseudobdellovibrio sp.]